MVLFSDTLVAQISGIRVMFFAVCMFWKEKHFVSPEMSLECFLKTL